MDVSCCKGYLFTTDEPFAPKHNPIVSIYYNICSNVVLCNDKSCEYYDDTKQGDILFREGKVEALSSIEGLIKNDKNKKKYLEKHNLEDIQEDMTPALEHVYKHNPEIVHNFVKRYCEEHGYPLEEFEFEGDFKSLQKMLLKKNIKIIFPEDFLRGFDKE